MKNRKSNAAHHLVLALTLSLTFTAPQAHAAGKSFGERLLRGLFSGGKDKAAAGSAAPVETARASLLEELTKAKVEVKKAEAPSDAAAVPVAVFKDESIVPRIEGRIIRGTEKNPTRVILLLDQSDSTKENFDGSTRAATIAQVANKAIRTLIDNNSDSGIATDRVEIAVIGYNRGASKLLTSKSGSAFVSLSELDGRDLPQADGVTQWISPASSGSTNTDIGFKAVQALINEKLSNGDGQKKLFLVAHLTDAELGNDPTATLKEIVASVTALDEMKEPKGQIVVTNAQISSTKNKPILFGTAAQVQELTEKDIREARTEKERQIAQYKFAQALLKLSSRVPRRRIEKLGVTEDNFMYGYGITDTETLLQILVAGTDSQGGR